VGNAASFTPNGYQTQSELDRAISSLENKGSFRNLKSLG
jgi:hypothetical protein